uniref:Uncharacterized protein n=1 Tax=Oryza punctata TaxID=4537 RepID=A0A0E0LZJ3_ORYPU
MVRSGFREAGVMLQPFGSCSSTEIVDYVSSSKDYNDSNTETISSCEFDDDYTPLFFDVFMVDIRETASRLPGELLKKNEPNTTKRSANARRTTIG